VILLRIVDAKRLVENSRNVVGRDRVRLATGGGLIGCTDDLSAPYAAAVEQAEHCARIVISPAPGRPLDNHGRAPEFARGEDAGRSLACRSCAAGYVGPNIAGRHSPQASTAFCQNHIGSLS
jgi:hypothetical protein